MQPKTMLLQQQKFKSQNFFLQLIIPDNLSLCLVDTVYPQKILPNNKKESSKKVKNEMPMKNENILAHLYIRTCDFYFI